MIRFFKPLSSLTILLACSQTFAWQVPGHFLFEIGAFRSTQGQSQTIDIDTLVGDRFNVTDRNDWNALLGAGFIMNGYQCFPYGIDYGVNVFYLAKTRVSGTIDQELLFTNLSYKYDVTNVPVYLFAKGYLNMNSNIGLTLDLGVGPNFMKTDMHGDTSLDGITLPDNAFTGSRTTTTFSAMAGIGVKFNVMCVPLEIGYRYFYLGEGEFKPRNDAIQNKLKTGQVSAHALMLTAYV